jgi:hypothetical protein
MCCFCGTRYGDRIYRNTQCPECGKELKICLNCRFYDPGAHWECRETIPEPVRDKERANFCDYFSYVLRNTGEEKDREKQTKARADFDSLFGDG